MTLTLDDWHRRFEQQARWTEVLRAHIFSQAGIQHAVRILEVGCGTGVVTASAARTYPAIRVVGVDLDIPRLHFARNLDPASRYAGGDALRLPFQNGEFDLTFCHYLLLWIREPRKALSEMIRVTRHGGWVAALAEPDYGGRIDFPTELADIGRRQRKALQRQGADPDIGRKLAGLFSGSGVHLQAGGVLGSQTGPGVEEEADMELEWSILREDVGEDISDSAWHSFREADRAARISGRRVLYVPTFYAAGTV